MRIPSYLLLLSAFFLVACEERPHLVFDVLSQDAGPRRDADTPDMATQLDGGEVREDATVEVDLGIEKDAEVDAEIDAAVMEDAAIDMAIDMAVDMTVALPDAGIDASTPCPDGFEGTVETGCRDINECERDLDDCNPLATCRNTPGSFVCGRAPTFELTVTQIKQFVFTWTPVAVATRFELYEDPDGLSGYDLVADDITGTTYAMTVSLHYRVGAKYLLRGCIDAVCYDIGEVNAGNSLATGIGYIKASNTDGGDSFGHVVTLSGDGETLAVASRSEAGSAQGINGADDDLAPNAGAVYVYRHAGDTWVQEAYIKGLNTEAGDQFGIFGVSLTHDGNMLAVGAPFESSAIPGDPSDNSSWAAGAVYVFERTDGEWAQSAYLKSDSPAGTEQFGYSVNISADGNTLAVGGPDGPGNVYMFDRIGGVWTQVTRLVAPNREYPDEFGIALALSADGSTVAIGAHWEASASPGVGADQDDNSAYEAGAVYIFSRDDLLGWQFEEYLKASNPDAGDFFGSRHNIAISADGSWVAVCAPGEDGDGVDPMSNSVEGSGAVYIFHREAGAWSESAYLKSPRVWVNAQFGYSVDFSADGTKLLAGEWFGLGNSVGGFSGSPASATWGSAGAAYLYEFNGTTWDLIRYFQPSNPYPNQVYGNSVSISDDTSIIAIGARGEYSSATGISGDQTDRSAYGAGAVYLY